MPDMLKIYHRLPYRAKVLAASARGRYLTRWRYGAETERLVADILAHEQWTPAQWAAWREERLAFVLRRAAAEVPYYRDQWARRRAAGDKASPELLENWPVLSKEVLRAQPRAFLADDCDPKTMFNEHTSGTTGKPLHIWLSRDTVRAWFALFEARTRRWYGVNRFTRWAILGGQLVAPVERRRPPFWVWNMGQNQLYLSAYHLAPENIAAYVAAMKEHSVRYLLGYPSGLYRLAQVMLDNGIEPPSLSVVVGNAEPLLDHQREAIGRAFGCPVRETYGMAEVAAAAGECEAGRMHVWPEVGHIEILSDTTDEPVAAGQAGRIIATGLLNADMPLVRYETGDRAAQGEGGCGCGRTLPLLRGLEGRVDNVVITRDGRHIGRLDPVFKADLPILEAQIIQEDWELIRVLYVPTEAYTAQDGEMLAQRIRDRAGDGMEIVLQAVDEVPRTSNGKFRAVVSRVARRERMDTTQGEVS